MITREEFDTMIRIHETDKILAHFHTSNTPLTVLCPGSGSWKEQFNSKEEYLKRMEAWNGGYTTWTKYVANINNDTGVIGFCSFIEDGIRKYGCRGTGKVYHDFYDNFLIEKSYKFIESDFPWSYFIFTDINDEQKFLNKYRLSINFQVEEE